MEGGTGFRKEGLVLKKTASRKKGLFSEGGNSSRKKGLFLGRKDWFLEGRTGYRKELVLQSTGSRKKKLVLERTSSRDWS